MELVELLLSVKGRKQYAGKFAFTKEYFWRGRPCTYVKNACLRGARAAYSKSHARTVLRSIVLGMVCSETDKLPTDRALLEDIDLVRSLSVQVVAPFAESASACSVVLIMLAVAMILAFILASSSLQLAKEPLKLPGELSPPRELSALAPR